MKLLQFILYCLFFAQMAFSAAAQSKDGWVLKSQRNAIKVFYRKTSDIHELKLTTSIKTPLSGIVHLLDDVDKYTVWGYKISEARLIKRISPTEIIYYSRIDFPWPMSDRDVVLRTTVEQDLQNNAVTSSSVAVAGWAPEVKDVIRLKKANTRWTVIPGANGWMYVEYYLYSDPGGNLPDWAINLAIDVGPRETIKRMREILKDPLYQNAKLAHIRE